MEEKSGGAGRTRTSDGMSIILRFFCDECGVLGGKGIADELPIQVMITPHPHKENCPSKEHWVQVYEGELTDSPPEYDYAQETWK